MHVQVEVSGNPDTLYESLGLISSLRYLPIQGEAEPCRWCLTSKSLELYLPDYLRHLQWYARKSKAGISGGARIFLLPKDEKRAQPYLDALYWVYVHPPRRMEIRDVREWDLIAPSAGLPTLGKRR